MHTYAAMLGFRECGYIYIYHLFSAERQGFVRYSSKCIKLKSLQHKTEVLRIGIKFESRIFICFDEELFFITFTYYLHINTRIIPGFCLKNLMLDRALVRVTDSERYAPIGWKAKRNTFLHAV